MSLSQQAQPPAPVVPLQQSEKVQKEHEVYNIIQSLCTALGITKCQSSRAFEQESADTKRWHVGAIARVVDGVVHIMAPDAVEQFYTLLIGRLTRREFRKWTEVASFSKFDKIMRSIADYYLESDSKTDKLHALALSASTVTFADLQQYLPGISHHYYTDARSIFKQYGFAARVQPVKTVRVRVQYQKIQKFVGFVTLPENIVSLPYGTKQMKLTDGTKLTIPGIIKMTKDSRTIMKYYKFLKEINEYDQYYIAPRTLHRILDVLAGSVRKTMQGLDSYSYNGKEGIKQLTNLVQRAKEKFALGQSWAVPLTKKLREGSYYVASDLKHHMKTNSQVAKHDLLWSLSDPANPKFRAEKYPDPKALPHNYMCPHCVELQLLLLNLAKELCDDRDWGNDQNEVVWLVMQSIDDIQRWIAHQARATYQNMVFSLTKMNLLPRTQLVLICDFGMKIIPISGSESQEMWYGKNGLSWHLCRGWIKPAQETALEKWDFVHMIGKSKQIGQDVFAMLVHLLPKAKIQWPLISEVIIRTDNGPHYKQSGLMASVHSISEKTGIFIKHWSFSEAQSGKADCDSLSSTIKNHVHQYAAAGHRVTTPEEFMTAVRWLDAGPARINYYLGNVVESQTHQQGDQSPPAKKAKKQTQPHISGISKFHDFVFETTTQPMERDIRVWQHYNIGPGELVKRTKWQGMSYSTFFVEKDSYRKSSEDSGALSEQEDREDSGLIQVDFEQEIEEEMGSADHETCSTLNDNAEINDQPSEQVIRKTFFDCPEEGCVKKFHKFGNLQRHLQLGNHKILPMRMTTLDYAMNTYKQNLEGICFQQFPPVMAESLQDFNQAGQCSASETELEQVKEREKMGWGLKPAVQQTRFTPAHHAYLMKKYDEGERTKRKWTGEDVAADMRKAKGPDGKLIFPSPDDWLKPGQIESYFSRVTKHRREESWKREEATRIEAHQSITHMPAHEERGQSNFPNINGGLPPEEIDERDHDQDYLYDPTLPILPQMISKGVTNLESAGIELEMEHKHKLRHRRNRAWHKKQLKKYMYL